MSEGNGTTTHSGNGKPLTNEERQAAELAIVDGPPPDPIDPIEEQQFLGTHPELASKLDLDHKLKCYGEPCSPTSPCGPCVDHRRWIALTMFRERHGRYVHPSDAAGYPEPQAAAAIILDSFRKRHRPICRRGVVVVCADASQLRMQDAIVPDSAVLARLAKATDAPRDRHGTVDPDSLPAFFAKWAKVAWGDLRRDLPEEVAAPIGADSPVREAFIQLVREALCRTITLGDTIDKTTVTQTERKPLITWCQKFAKPGPWRDIRSLPCYCRVREIDGELELQVAVRHELFATIGAAPRLRDMGATMFAQLARKYGVGISTEKDRPHGRKAVVLDTDLVRDLTTGVSDGEENLPGANPDGG